MNLDTDSTAPRSDALDPSSVDALSAHVASARKCMQDASTGELHAAKIIVGLENDWEKTFREETQSDWASWVTKTFGAGKVRRFRGLYEAAQALRPHWRGNDLMTRFHQDVLLRIAGDTVPENKRKECLVRIRARTSEKGLPILAPNASYAIVREVCGRVTHEKRETPERAAMKQLWADCRAEIQRLDGNVPTLPWALGWLE